jgi:predicted nuclease of predicted toxin-antitoxin system
MRLLANMNISPLVVSDLRDLGWDILRVSDLLPANSPDDTVLKLARQEGRVSISQDLDFSRLLALAGFDSPSLITLRLTRSDPGAVCKRLREILPSMDELVREGCAVTVDDDSIRFRRLPIVPD